MNVLMKRHWLYLRHLYDIYGVSVRDDCTFHAAIDCSKSSSDLVGGDAMLMVVIMIKKKVQ